MFRTIVNIPEAKNKIDFESVILTMGSCFAENIGQRFFSHYFNILVNPFGILFNPSSISQNIRKIISGKLFEKVDLFQYNDIWNSFAHSTLFSKTNQDDTLRLINESLLNAYKTLQSADFLLITWGTSWIYERIETKEIVANCHKLPASDFSRRRLSVEEIFTDYQLLIRDLKFFNPNLKIILTVSPVRHFKDGAHENNLSKSTLLLASDQLTKQFDSISYFPAYELQMDDLRDYRFYADDMCHPSEQAIEYIWNHFSGVFFDHQTKTTIRDIASYNSMKNHKFLHPDTSESKIFQQKVVENRKKLILKYPFLENRIVSKID